MLCRFSAYHRAGVRKAGVTTQARGIGFEGVGKISMHLTIVGDASPVDGIRCAC